ncbi:MAG TPA: PIG-L family deacetylase [Verrucomicrobiae bacterium]|nr:PIG-L family deacetylase [Verrucomicrobiae bacterium]
MRGRTLAAVALLAAVSAAAGLRWLAPPPRVGASPEPPGSGGPARPASSVASLALPEHPRVIVFAPHPDDETVGVGGLLFRLAQARVPLRVVFVTNGDGYRRALEQDFAVERPTDADYVAFGELRQREALAALAHLGVAPQDVRFLGFPDGGLAELWRAHWLRTHPYTSPYTNESSPPDAEGVGYDGQDLTSIVSGILGDFGPTVVFMPHPYDTHLDHAHTSYFVTEALSELDASGALAPAPTVLTYLVHHPRWPALRGPGFDRELPLAELPDTRWSESDLTPAELAAKRAALEEYRSQLGVMNGFLHHFLCRNELFATIDPEVLVRIAAVH